jgi:hypothetical protein
MRFTRANLQLVKEETQAALTNEQITRKRVDGLEDWVKVANALLSRGFWGRMRWVLTGK